MDKIAIISPATEVKAEYIDGAVHFLAGKGLDPVVMPNAKGPSSGSFASSVESRVTDLKEALHDSSVKAILCARGGYGCVHLLPYFTADEIRENAKWIIGFSDVSALHALWHSAGVASIHGPMAKHLTIEGAGDICSRELINRLAVSSEMDYEVASHPLNRRGQARGCLLGGNLAVLNGLAGTPYDMLSANDPEGVILFIEDISEAIYAVERMLIRLHLSGTLHRIKGLIVGQFTEYRPDRNHTGMEDMIDALLSRHGVTGIPVAFNFPVGHVTYNLPLVEGVLVDFVVAPDSVKLKTVV